MAVDKKISQLPSGAPAQAGDEYVVARSGANYKLTLTNIAASMPATTITSGNLTFSGTAQRITGDMSNATLANRLMFQTSTTNGATQLRVIPNGTGTTGSIQAGNNNDPANQSVAALNVDSSEVRLASQINGTGSYLPMTFYTGGSERVRIDTSGNMGIGLSSLTIPLQIGKGGGGNPATSGTTQTYGIARIGSSGAAALDVGTYAAGQVWMQGVNVTNLATNYDLVLQPNGGNVGIGRAPNYQLDVYRSGTTNTTIAAANDNIVNILQVSGNTAGVVGTITSHPLIFTAGNTERMRIDSSGNVGIGGTAGGNVKTQLQGSYPVLGGNANTNGIAISMEVPSAITASAFVFRSLPSIAASTATTNVYQYGATNVTLGSGATLTNNFGFFADAMTSATNNYGFYGNIASGSNRWNFYAAGTANNYFAGKTGIGILPTAHSSYRLVVDGSPDNATLFKTGTTAAAPVSSIWHTGTSGDNWFIDFYTETAATLRGSITYNRGAGQVAYNVTSDYRAKDVYGAWDDAGATIDALKVYRGKMHGATLERPMMIAHEAQAVVPYAVSGEKDGVDKDGKPVYQQMDHSVLVPLLIAELQAVRARLAALEAK